MKKTKTLVLTPTNAAGTNWTGTVKVGVRIDDSQFWGGGAAVAMATAIAQGVAVGTFTTTDDDAAPGRLTHTRSRPWARRTQSCSRKKRPQCWQL